MIYVIDSSFLCALIIPDEKNTVTDRMHAKIKNGDEKHSPHLVWYEVANVFNNLIRRRRYTFNEVLQFFPRLEAMCISLKDDFATGAEYSKKIFRLCNDHNLSSYDAAYLELAERKKAVLCTVDDNLKAAARKIGVAVLR